eukprot:5076336-Prymnesium_polylepis.2
MFDTKGRYRSPLHVPLRYTRLNHSTHQSSPMFGPGRAYEARGAGVCSTISSSASVHMRWCGSRFTADSAKTTAAETAAAWWPYNDRGDEREML